MKLMVPDDKCLEEKKKTGHAIGVLHNQRQRYFSKSESSYELGNFTTEK